MQRCELSDDVNYSVHVRDKQNMQNSMWAHKSPFSVRLGRYDRVKLYAGIAQNINSDSGLCKFIDRSSRSHSLFRMTDVKCKIKTFFLAIRSKLGAAPVILCTTER